jgi:hypothetical protein
MSIESRYYEVASAIPGAMKSQLFGKSCYKIDGKPFVSFFQECMIFKLTGEAHSAAIALKDACLFDPSGKKRPMREWVQLNANHQHHWKRFAEEALNYVAQ